MNALPLIRKATRAALYALLFTLALTAANAQAQAQERIKGELAIATDAGYLRLIFRLDEEVPAKVRISGAIMVITFEKPISIAVDRINAAAPNYVSASRLDPDGKAIRIALARAVKINSIPAAERLYVDIMPDNWAGVLPGLPQEVVDDLSRRTREAERQLRSQRVAAKQKQMQTIRVKVATQPTFVRYVFDVPEQVNATPERGDGKLTINFDQQIKWDLADAKAALPSSLESIEAETDFGSAAVTFTLNGTPDVRAFREEGSVVIDVGIGIAKPKIQMKEGGATVVASAPETVPAVEAPEAAPIKDAPAAEQAAKPASPVSPPPLVDAAAPAPAKTVQAPAPQPSAQQGPLQQAAAAPKPAAAAAVLPKPAAPAVVAPAEAPVVAAAPRPAPNPDAPVVAIVNRNSGGLKVELPFAVPTPSAVFRRADVLWMVFDSPAKIDVTPLMADTADLVRSAEFTRGLDGEGIVRMRLARPLLASLDSDGPSWIVNIGETVMAPSKPLTVARTAPGKGRASIVIPFADPARIHRMGDPGFGDQIMVVTALGPARGFIKSQDFVELRTLASTHGVVVQPIADDIAAELSADKITIGRPGGLSISPTLLGAQQQVAPNFRGMTFDTQLWGFDRQAKFSERQAELIRLAASAPPTQRKPARFNLARFYLAQEMPAEAKAVLDVAMADDRNNNDAVTGSILRSIANVMMDRSEEALKELTAPGVGDQQEAPVWRAIAYARQGKWDEARAGFKNIDGALSALPVQLQRMAISQALRSAIEVRDFLGATRMVNELETIGVPPELEPSVAVLTGRLNEGVGRNEDALTSYRAAAASNDRRSAAQGRLREILLLFGSGDMPRQDVIHQLETITTVWRGDETEVEGLKLLAHLYTEDGRYREAFHTMRTAMRAHPNSDLTRKIQDEAASTFDTLFLAGKGDSLPPIEALGLFYDFRELTPVGSRGDEMIRRLADRLVSVDLLDQATELLQHQVDNRLKGAGRAQVATRLATIYLMNRKPDRALAALQNTRVSDLANELRDQRLLLEARAMSDIGRHGLALELIANINSREAVRLRSDILWTARHWRDAAEQIELLYGDRWREFTPLNDGERVDILRAAIGYQLADEQLSLTRLREKYAAKMSDGPDRRAFDVVSTPIGAASTEFQDVAKRVSSTDTLSAFLADMRKRYPENLPPPQPKAVPPLAEKPKAPISKADVPEKAANAASKRPDVAASALPPKPPSGTPLKPDTTPTGSIGPRRLPKAISAQR
jgi:tetratricopeptide (TPR) repeat protein